MKVLFVNLKNFGRIPNAIELELANKCLLDGDQLVMLKCNRAFAGKCFGPTQKKSRCLYCVAEQVIGRKSVLKNSKNIKAIELNRDVLAPFEEGVYPLDINNIDELKDYYSADGYDVGMGIASLLISCFGKSHFNFDDNMKRTVNKFNQEIFGFGKFIEQIINEEHIEKIFLWNGRMPYNRIVFRIAQEKKIDIETFECSYTLNRYAVFHNALPHDFDYRADLIEKYWNESEINHTEKERIASEWFENKMKGQDTGSINFTRFMKDNAKLPILPGKKNIVIFLSTEDEMEAIGNESKRHLFENQNDAIKKFLEYGYWNKNIHFILRAHPNLVNYDNDQTDYIRSLHSEIMDVILPESEVSSYQLIKAADLVVVFYSTIGIEACYQKKPVILIERAAYEKLPGIYIPNSQEDLFQYINNFDVKKFNGNDSYLSSLKFGWFILNFGEKYKIFTRKGEQKIKFKKIKNINQLYYNLLQSIVDLKQIFVKIYKRKRIFENINKKQ